MREIDNRFFNHPKIKTIYEAHTDQIPTPVDAESKFLNRYFSDCVEFIREKKQELMKKMQQISVDFLNHPAMAKAVSENKAESMNGCWKPVDAKSTQLLNDYNLCEAHYKYLEEITKELDKE